MSTILTWLDGLSGMSFLLLICIGLAACQIAFAMIMK